MSAISNFFKRKPTYLEPQRIGLLYREVRYCAAQSEREGRSGANIQGSSGAEKSDAAAKSSSPKLFIASSNVHISGLGGTGHRATPRDHDKALQHVIRSVEKHRRFFGDAVAKQVVKDLNNLKSGMDYVGLEKALSPLFPSQGLASKINQKTASLTPSEKEEAQAPKNHVTFDVQGPCDLSKSKTKAQRSFRAFADALSQREAGKHTLGQRRMAGKLVEHLGGKGAPKALKDLKPGSLHQHIFETGPQLLKNMHKALEDELAKRPRTPAVLARIVGLSDDLIYGIPFFVHQMALLGDAMANKLPDHKGSPDLNDCAKLAGLHFLKMAEQYLHPQSPYMVLYEQAKTIKRQASDALNPPLASKGESQVGATVPSAERPSRDPVPEGSAISHDEPQRPGDAHKGKKAKAPAHEQVSPSEDELMAEIDRILGIDTKLAPETGSVRKSGAQDPMLAAEPADSEEEISADSLLGDLDKLLEQRTPRPIAPPDVLTGKRRDQMDKDEWMNFVRGDEPISVHTSSSGSLRTGDEQDPPLSQADKAEFDRIFDESETPSEPIDLPLQPIRLPRSKSSTPVVQGGTMRTQQAKQWAARLFDEVEDGLAQPEHETSAQVQDDPMLRELEDIERRHREALVSDEALSRLISLDGQLDAWLDAEERMRSPMTEAEVDALLNELPAVTPSDKSPTEWQATRPNEAHAQPRTSVRLGQIRRGTSAHVEPGTDQDEVPPQGDLAKNQFNASSTFVRALHGFFRKCLIPVNGRDGLSKEQALVKAWWTASFPNGTDFAYRSPEEFLELLLKELPANLEALRQNLKTLVGSRGETVERLLETKIEEAAKQLELEYKRYFGLLEYLSQRLAQQPGFPHDGVSADLALATKTAGESLVHLKKLLLVPQGPMAQAEQFAQRTRVEAGERLAFLRQQSSIPVVAQNRRNADKGFGSSESRNF